MLATPGLQSRADRHGPSVLDENMLNISRRRSPYGKQLPSSRIGQQQQRVPSQPRALRQAASTPVLRNLSARHRLKPRGSRLDLLDNQNLTSFPSLSFTDDSTMHIIEDYFPAKPVELNQPLDPTSNSWSVLIQKKLRWRWRLTGLLP